MKRIKFYLTIWYLMTRNSFQSVLSQKLSIFIFLLGKVVRFSLYFLFLSFLLNGTQSLAGYSREQVLFIFLTFGILDTTSQFLFREIYRFRPMVVSGEFDLVLVKPFSALFRSLAGGADIIDLITIPPLYLITFLVGRSLNPDPISAILYIALVVNALIIAAAFHTVVLAIGIMTTEVDHTVMIYRDVTSLARFPIDIYKQPLQSVLTFIIPLAFMVTLPARSLFGISATQMVVAAFLIGGISLMLSLRFWRFALSKYSSASS